MSMPTAAATLENPDSQLTRALERVQGECEQDPEAAVARFNSAF